MVLVKKVEFFSTSTTPSALADVASRLFLLRAATPPRLRRGMLAKYVNALILGGSDAFPKSFLKTVHETEADSSARRVPDQGSMTLPRP